MAHTPQCVMAYFSSALIKQVITSRQMNQSHYELPYQLLIIINVRCLKSLSEWLHNYLLHAYKGISRGFLLEYSLQNRGILMVSPEFTYHKRQTTIFAISCSCLWDSCCESINVVSKLSKPNWRSLCQYGVPQTVEHFGPNIHNLFLNIDNL